MLSNMSQLLTVPQVAELLQMSEYSVRENARRGKLPGIKVGQQWRFREEDLEQYLSPGTAQQKGHSVELTPCPDMSDRWHELGLK